MNKQKTPYEICCMRRDKIFQKKSRQALLRKILIIGAILFIVYQCFIGIYMESGQSMYPLVRDGDVVFYYQLKNQYELRDVVVYWQDDLKCIGRIVAVEGDRVDMSEEGDLLINGNVQSEDILYPTYKTDASVKFPYTVPKGQVFLLGDMRTGATDSRDYGGVQLKNIDGIVFTIVTRRGI